MPHNNTSKHNQIGNVIGEAKAKLLRQSREGVGLSQAVEEFSAEIKTKLTAIALESSPIVQESAKSDSPEDSPETYPHRYEAALRELGLDWRSIDYLADTLTNTGEDDHLIVALVLVERLARLAAIKREEAFETLDNYLPLLRDHLFRHTYHVEELAPRYADIKDRELRKAAAMAEQGGAA